MSEPTAGARLLIGERDGVGDGDLSVELWVWIEKGWLRENQRARERDSVVTSIF